MFPAESRLLPLCLRYLQIHCLGEAPPAYEFPVDENAEVPPAARSDPGSIPILLKINDDVVNDNFYSLRAVCDGGSSLVKRGTVKVFSWRLETTVDDLVLKIEKAVTITNTVSTEFPVVPLRHNAAVRAALRDMRLQVVRNIAKSLPIIDVVESDAEIAEVEEKPILVTPARRAVPPAVEKPHPEAMDVDPQATPQPPSLPQSASTSRKRRTPHSASPYRVKKPKVPIDSEPIANFPPHALEFLRQIFKA